MWLPRVSITRLSFCISLRASLRLAGILSIPEFLALVVTEIVDVGIDGATRGEISLESVKTRRKAESQGEVGVCRRIGTTELDSCSGAAACGNTDEGLRFCADQAM